MDIQKPFTETCDFIQKEMVDMKTKAEILYYLDMVKDFIGFSIKIAKTQLKDME